MLKIFILKKRTLYILLIIIAILIIGLLSWLFMPGLEETFFNTARSLRCISLLYG
ncbi:MAG TPA: hypothetical protein GX503_03860 [Clostridiales bacterium]|nr:hypothetical protein [Clostridiales bacterium]